MPAGALPQIPLGKLTQIPYMVSRRIEGRIRWRGKRGKWKWGREGKRGSWGIAPWLLGG